MTGSSSSTRPASLEGSSPATAPIASSSSSTAATLGHQQQQQQQQQQPVIAISNNNESNGSGGNKPSGSVGGGSSQAGRSAFEWDVYRNRRTALQYLKGNSTLVDTIIETEDGRAHELVHSQVMSAFGDRLTCFMAEHGVPIIRSDNQLTGSVGTSNPPTTPPPPPPTTTTTSDVSQATTTATTATTTQPDNGARDQSQPTDSNNQTSASTTNTTTSTPVKGLRLVRLPRVTSYVLNILVECAYTGYIRTDLGSGGIWQVLDVADFYQMEDVIRACCTFLTKNLTPNNCIEFYHIGIRYRHPLQRSAWHQIRAHFKQLLARECRGVDASAVVENHHQQQLDASLDQDHQQPEPQPQPPVAATSQASGAHAHASLATIKFEHFEPLLLHDKLNVDSEESVWQAIRLWCNHNLAERHHQLARLLPCMRFPRFRTGTEFSSRQIWRDPLIVHNSAAQHQLAVLDRNHRDFLSGGGGNSRGSNPSSASSALGGLFRDGFNLPCALNPRQLRPRVSHSVLLAIGGWQQGQPTTLIESYDVNCNLWFEARRRITSPLAYHGIEFINQLLYICGGTDGSEILNEMFTFDPVLGVCLQRPSMREARCYVSTAHLQGHLYAMGGHNGVQRMRSVERFDLQAETWAHVRDMNVARSDASACVHGQLIYIAGGLNDQVIESSVEFYNPADDSWTFISSMLVPRTSFTLLNFCGGLLAIGGNNGTDRLNSVEQYSFASKLWTTHSQMRHRRSTFSAALVDDTKVFVVGGYNGQTPFAQVEMWDEAARAWVPMHKIRYDRSGLKVVVIKDLPNAHEYTFLGSTQAAQGGGNVGHHNHHHHHYSLTNGE